MRNRSVQNILHTLHIEDITTLQVLCKHTFTGGIQTVEYNSVTAFINFT